MSRLASWLDGGARLVLVVGDAGVGKTRFAAEGIARAAAAGVVMVRGECLPLAGALPLLPVVAALGELARREGGGLLRAALEAAPQYVRGEVGRLVPGLGPDGEPAAGGPDDGWRRERLFSAVAELLDGVAAGGGGRVGLVVEDVHWADSATLDCLTFLARAWWRDTLTVVVTCRGDEAPLAGHVADWLAQVRGAAGVAEIRLGPLSRAEVAGQVAALAGGQVPAGLVDEVYARAEGNPFFTEQLAAAALAGAAGGGLGAPAGLPGRLAELLAARAGRCTGDAQAVLAGLAVAGRPLDEDLLGAVTGLPVEGVRTGLRELAAARLLADDTTGTAHRPRHALLAEAVADRLLPGERAALHQQAARALAASENEMLAAEIVGHWQAAGRPAEELPARMTAGEVAERVFGYAEAAAHWQRVIELCRANPRAVAELDVPRIYVRAIDALFLAGDGERAAEVAEEAYRRFAKHTDTATAAVIRHHAAFHRSINDAAAGLQLMADALRLYEQAPPSADHAMARLDYVDSLLNSGQGQDQAETELNRALEIAEAAGATALIPRVLSRMADDAFLHGRVGEGIAVLERGWSLARAAGDGPALLRLAVSESDALLKLAEFRRAADVARDGLGTARQIGLEASLPATILAFNASEALLALGRTAEAAALIDPLTSEPPDRLHWPTHEARAEIDLLRGDIQAAGRLRQQVDAIFAPTSHIEFARESAQRAADIALWAGRPGDALAKVRKVLWLPQAERPVIFSGRLLVTGMRACADLAEQARARHDEPAGSDAADAADELVAWVGRLSGTPFTQHPLAATIPAERATWEAERTRLAGTSDPGAWGRAASAWQGLGCPHRAGYAWWRQAQAQLDRGQPPAAAADALRAAAAAADGHAPLLAQVRTLAERARIPLQAQAGAPAAPPPTREPTPYGLTDRELAVLRLLAAGHSNAQIGGELYISPKTASVHVSSILRKLGVSGRVQAAALAERAGLLPANAPKAGPTGT